MKSENIKIIEGPLSELAEGPLSELATAWLGRRQWFVKKDGGDCLSDALQKSLQGITVRGSERCLFVLLGLAWRSDGELQTALLQSIAGMLDRFTPRQWCKLDELSRPGYSYYYRAVQRSEKERALEKEAIEGLQQWYLCRSLEPIIERLGHRNAVSVLANMHPCGYVRQDAVRSLHTEPCAIAACLLRANDWVDSVRKTAVEFLFQAIPIADLSWWTSLLPLVMRLEICGRAAHGDLIDAVADLFSTAQGRETLLAEIGTSRPFSARSASVLARRIFDPRDYSFLQALLSSRDIMVRLDALRGMVSIIPTELLVQVASDRIPSLRRQALDILRKREAAELHALLQEACFDPSPGVRDYARFYLEKAGCLEKQWVIDEALHRLTDTKTGPMGALGCLFDMGGPDQASAVAELIGHPQGRIRLLVKRCLLKWQGAAAAADERILEDSSPKVSRQIVGVLRELGVTIDMSRIWDNLMTSTGSIQKRAWLTTIARGPLWHALPYLVQALDIPDLVGLAKHHLRAVICRRYSGYIRPDEELLMQLAEAIGQCRDGGIQHLKQWIRDVTGRRTWPD